VQAEEWGGARYEEGAEGASARAFLAVEKIRRSAGKTYEWWVRRADRAQPGEKGRMSGSGLKSREVKAVMCKRVSCHLKLGGGGGV